MKTSKSQLGLWIVALLTSFVGVVNLVSAVTPGASDAKCGIFPAILAYTCCCGTISNATINLI